MRRKHLDERAFDWLMNSFESSSSPVRKAVGVLIAIPVVITFIVLATVMPDNRKPDGL